MILPIKLMVLATALLCITSSAFVNHHSLAKNVETRKLGLFMSMNPSEEEQKDEACDEEHIEYYKDKPWDAQTVESLKIRLTRMRLEDERKRKFLKSRPRKFPYEECKKWAQAQNMFHTKDEWFEYINRGENLSSYIPSDPETYFKQSGTWISWEDFLGR
jgi:response regulator RpfG family c-di-GMP phosphodiesterase